jgi:glycine cleavage system pyridoxal-binding protein P
MSNSQADLNKQLDSMRKEFEEVNTQFYDARTAETNNPNERSKLLQKAIIRKAKLQMQLDKLREHLLSTLEEQSKRDQKLAEIAGFVSYILIGVGLTISVAAQIVAKPGEAPEFKLG